MATETYKILGQTVPTAATSTSIYTVPASTQSVVSTITVCNRSATATAFRVATLIGGGTVATTDYIAYDHPIDGNATITFTLGVTLATTDEIEVYATLATLTFQAYGVELT